MLPKFRAWRTATKTMHKVASLAFDDVGFIMKSAIVIEGEYNLCPVSNSEIILMQSTGLFDSAGVEIYLGDIVQREYEYGPASIAPIIYVPRCAKFMLNQKNEKGGWDTDVDVYKTTKLTVLGNRYQHPHLLDKTA